MAATTPTLASDLAVSTSALGAEEVLGARQRVDAPEVGLERLAGGPEADHADAGGDAGEHAGQRDRRDGQQRGLAGGAS